MSISIILITIGVCIGVILATIGGFLLFAPIPFDSTTTAEVVSSICAKGSCSVELKFNDGNSRTYIKKATLSGEKISAGTKITILYDSKNPHNFYPGDPPIRLVGGGIGLIGVVILLGMLAWGIFIYRSSRVATPMSPIQSFSFVSPSPPSSSPTPTPSSTSILPTSSTQ
jgi:hypothetical protein